VWVNRVGQNSSGRTRAAMSFVRLSRSNFFGLPPLRKSGVSFPIAHRRQCGVSGGAPLTSVFVIQKHCSLSPFTFSLGYRKHSG
jgi:hypothetical protein